MGRKTRNSKRRSRRHSILKKRKGHNKTLRKHVRFAAHPTHLHGGAPLPFII